MKNESKSLIILCIYVIVMVGVLVLSVYILNKPSENVQIDTDLNAYVSKEEETKIIYVPIYSEITSENEETTTPPQRIKYFTVKSYGEKIGIFNEEEILVDVIEVYTKTLPKADRELLEKGIVVFSDVELRSIIEDYTG